MMTKTLLMINDKRRGQLYSNNLRIYTNTDVKLIQSPIEALHHMQKAKGINLLVLDYSMGSEAIRLMIKNSLSCKYKIPIVYVGDENIFGKRVIHQHEKFQIKPFIKTCAEQLKINAQIMASIKVTDYIAFDLKVFEILSHAPCHLYKKDIRGYTLCLTEKSPLTSDKLKEFHKAGHQDLYVQNTDRLKFLNVYNAKCEYLLQTKSLKFNKRLKSLDKAMICAHQYIAAIGLDDQSAKLTLNCIEDMYQITLKKKLVSPFEKMLARVLKNDSSFLFKHSMLAAMLGSHVISKMPWGSEEQQQKFIFVSFFHDIYLRDHTWGQIRSEESLAALDLGETDHEMVRGHALKAAEIIRRYPKAPLGTDIIVKQHHGSRTGIGFPKIPSPAITPLAAIFMVIESLVHELFECQSAVLWDTQAVFKKIAKTMPPGNKSNQTLECLEAIDFDQVIEATFNIPTLE